MFDDENNTAHITFLTNEQNLDLMKPDADLIDDNQPYSGFAMAGKWLKEAFDVRNYWEASKRLGEEVAAYQWELNESGENFDKKKFGKEVLKSGVRHLGSDGLNTVGNLLKMTGENFKQNRGAPEPIEKLRFSAGENIVRLGEVFRSYAENVRDAKILAPSDEGGEISPKFIGLADSIGAGASQVLSMGLVSRFVGPKATYALFTAGGAGEMFDEALEKTGDVNAATELALTNAGVTYAIDRWFNPLPKTIAKNARVTAGEIAKEAIGAPLREAGSEVLQQMLAENLVRQAGLDDTQDLFEGLVESAIGAMAGSSMLVGANGSYYAASETYNRARQKILEKGVEPAALEIAEKGMLQVLKEHPEAFQKVLDTRFKKNIMAFEKEARAAQSAEERARAAEAAKGFPKVYDALYNKAKDAFQDETKAKTAASVLSAGAVTLYRHQPNLTTAQIVSQFLPEFKQMSYADFRRQTLPETAVSYMFGGQKAKHADLAKMSDALNALKQNVDAQDVWKQTGWHMGSDGKMRFEISDQEAQLKRWQPDEITVYSEKLFSKEMNELNEIKARMAAQLKDSATGAYGDYYKEFWNYLKAKVNTDYVFFDDNEKGYVTDYYKVMDEADDIKRMTETRYLYDLWQDYVNHERDFTEEEYKTVRAIWENRRYNYFLQNFVDTKFGMQEGLDALAAEIDDDLVNKPEFQQRLREIRNEAKAREEERRAAIEAYGLPDKEDFYQDIKLDEGYKTYALYSGDMSGIFADKDFRPRAYREAFFNQTLGEEFLTQDKFLHLSETDKKVLAEFLNKVEFLYRVDSRVERLQKAFRDRIKTRNEIDMEMVKNNPDSIEAQMKLQQRVLLENGTAMKLKDLLDHEALFSNYPEIADTRVEFKELKDDAPYHFYHDLEKGHVLEIDARALDYTGLKETLLKGAAFAIQDIEGFDYALSDTERRNFMDRQVFLARSELSDAVIGEIVDFLNRFPVTKSADDVVMMKIMPTSLAGLTETRATDAGAKDIRTGYYAEADFDKLSRFVDAYFADVQNPDEMQLRNFARERVQQMRNHYVGQVMTLARALGGYDAAWMPWGGLTAQGAVDERALIRRMDYSDEQRRNTPYWSNYEPEVMKTYDEFEKRSEADRQQYKKVLHQIAEGAYEYGNKTINLFESADAETIVHESFHYFWDMLNTKEFKNNTYAVEFNEAMNDLRQEFIKLYRVEKHDGRYYAIERATGEIAPEMPIGYLSAEAAADAGIEEMFVGTFLSVMNRQGKPDEYLSGAMDFYQNWLKDMTGKLGITSKTSGMAGQRILKFLKAARRR